jgi:hypothetical protein
MNISEIAASYIESGLSVLPVRPDGSKAPDISEWKTYQHRFPNADELVRFRNTAGVAIIAGAVSGNLEIYDFDDAESFTAWAALVEEHLGHEFFASLPVVKTPRPGFHVYTRCNVIGGNAKLAQISIQDGRRQQIKTLIETRGEGGYVLAPGSPATCHETGRTYELVQGSFSAIPQISVNEREVLFSCGRSFNQVWHDTTEARASSGVGTGTPGADFCERATWSEILKPHGFKSAGRRGDSELWTRPDKDHGVSASTNHSGSNLFYSFSTNCFPFEAERGYNKFGVYALLNHGGDFSAAAKQLGAEGFGIQKKPRENNPALVATAQPEIQSANSHIVQVLDLMNGIERLHVTGLQRGKSTGWSSLDEWYTVRKREWTLVTGFPNHGKSCWLDNVLVNLARRHDWKIGVFSAENLPLERYIASLMEIYTGKPFSKGANPRLTIPEVREASEWLHAHFKFINPSMEERRLERLLEIAGYLVREFKVDALVIDPWNELDHARPARLREDEYISVSLSKLRDFTRANNVHFFVVAHPAKVFRDKAGKYPVPTMFDVKGASEWNAKADNGVCIWRDMLDPDHGTDVHVQKVRFREVGKAGGGCNLKYDSVSGRFVDPNHRPSIDELVAKQAEPYRLREPGDDDQ